MVALKLDKSYYTFKEYLKFERHSNEKHEYHNGEIVAMAGGSLNHSVISNNIGTAINNALDKNGKDCVATNSDLKVYIESANHGVYPDVMVICGEEEFYEEDKTIVTNPSLIIEVLSKSTKAYDKGLKFEKYRTLPSFREYILVWQTIPKVQSWYKEEETLWRISSAFGLEASIPVFSLGCDIPLKEIYKRIKGLKLEDNFDAW